VARSLIDKLRPQFKAHEIKISVLDSTGEGEGPDERDDGGNRTRGPAKFRKASEIEDEESEPSWARSSSDDGDNEQRADDASAARPPFGQATHGRGRLCQSLRENALSEGLAQLSVDARHANSIRENKDGERPEPASRQNTPYAQSAGSPLHHDSSSVRNSHQTASAATTTPSPDGLNQRSSTRSLQKPTSVSPNTRINPHNPISIPTRRRSFADINQDASPELVDDAVYIDDDSTDYGYGPPDTPTSPSLGPTRRFTRSSIGRSSSLRTESDSGGRVSVEEASDSEMDMDAEWAQ
jgi:hypothetical protein